jgi:hypothetical protein
VRFKYAYFCCTLFSLLSLKYLLYFRLLVQWQRDGVDALKKLDYAARQHATADRSVMVTDDVVAQSAKDLSVLVRLVLDAERKW